MTDAAVYARLSQDRTGAGLAIERQVEDCRRLATELGVRVGKVYSDNDTSATTGKRRPAFEAMLRDRPSLIITWHTDRLMRVTKDLERVIDLGVPVHAVTAGHMDLATPAGRAVARTVTAWATYEGEQKALRQRAAYRQKAQGGRPHWTVRPYGYTLEGELVESEAAWVRRCYAEVLSGGSLRSLAAAMNRAGQVTTRGRAWDSSTIRAMLLPPRNAGLRTYQGEIIGAGEWRAIVPESVWRSTVALLTDPARRNIVEHRGRTPKYLLTGIATCGQCGGIVQSAWVVDRQKAKCRVYKCRYGMCVTRRADVVETAALRAVVDLWDTPDFARALGGEEESPEVADLTLKLDTLRRRREEIESAYSDGADMPYAEYRRLIAANESRQQEVQERLGGIVATLGPKLPPALRAKLVTLTGDRYSVQAAAQLARMDAVQAVLGLPMDEQRALVQALLERVEILAQGRGTRRGAAADYLRIVPRTAHSTGAPAQ